MVATYASVEDIADFLRIPICATTVPNDDQVVKLIERAQDKIDRRTGHAWRLRTITHEYHDMPLIYNFGWGTLVSLHHRMAQSLDACAGDKIEIWGGTSGSFSDVTDQIGGRYEQIPERGEIYFRGFLFSVMRKNRLRFTYRYGGEPGDCPLSIPIPEDIEEAAVKLTAIEFLTSSFRMDQLPLGAENQLDIDKIVNRWQSDVDRIIRNREEIYVITT